jgi:energy-coupling factor transporter transmembrane protein EcfT
VPNSILKKSISFSLNSAGPLARLFFAIALSLAAIMSHRFIFLGMLLLIAFNAHALWDENLKGIFKIGLFALPLAIFIFLLHLFFQPGEPFFNLWFLKATSAGAIAGCRYGLKLLVYAFAGYLIFISVDPFGLIQPLERLARKLGSFGRLVSAMAIAFFLAMRFLPELSAQSRNTLLALRSRGLDPKGNIIHKARVMLSVVASLFVTGFKRADMAALALDVKGYSTRYRRAVFVPLKPGIASYIIFASSILILMAGWRF